MTEIELTGVLLGYARVSAGHQHLDAQTDALTAAGVPSERIYAEKITGTSRSGARPRMTALLDYARPGDTVVVVGIDRLGRDCAEVMTTIRDLRDRDIVLKSLREGIDTGNATGRMVAGVLASLAEMELELGRERRAAAREARRARGQDIGRPPVLSKPQREQVLTLAAAGTPVAQIARTFGCGRDTVYRIVRAARDDEQPVD
jgi:DNA invertase Pin-like site-specific DNA recombinase